MWRQFAASWTLAVVFSCLVAGQIWDGPAKAAEIEKLRGSKIVLYDGPKGKKVKTMSAKAVVRLLPLTIGEAGVRNGRFPVNIAGTDYWIAKAQVKRTSEGRPDIAADCQTVTKSYASSRGLGNCK